MICLGLDLGHPDNPAAEHWLRDVVRPLGQPGLVACTHLVQVPYPHVAISLAVPGPDPVPAGQADPSAAGGRAGALAGRDPAGALATLPAVPAKLRAAVERAAGPAVPAELRAAAERAAAEHRGRSSGRAVFFPGAEQLVGTLAVGELLATSAIDRVTVLGGPPPEPGTLVQTRDFVRPQWLDGTLTLVTMPARAGQLTPFEVPNPTPCCADH